MGWRFRRRIKLFPGFYINISKSGLGVNIGPKGANLSIKKIIIVTLTMVISQFHTLQKRI